MDSDLRLQYEEELARLRAELAALREENADLYRKLLDVDESESRELREARALLARWMSDGRFVEEGERGCVKATRAFLDRRRDEGPPGDFSMGCEYCSGCTDFHAPDCTRLTTRVKRYPRDEARGAAECCTSAIGQPLSCNHQPRDRAGRFTPARRPDRARRRR